MGHTCPSQRENHFFEVRDGTGDIQCVVFRGEVDPDVFEIAKSLKIESSCTVEGVVRRDDRSNRGYEKAVKKYCTDTPAGGRISDFSQRTRCIISHGKPSYLASLEKADINTKNKINNY